MLCCGWQAATNFCPGSRVFSQTGFVASCVFFSSLDVAFFHAVLYVYIISPRVLFFFFFFVDIGRFLSALYGVLRP